MTFKKQTGQDGGNRDLTLTHPETTQKQAGFSLSDCMAAITSATTFTVPSRPANDAGQVVRALGDAGVVFVDKPEVLA